MGDREYVTDIAEIKENEICIPVGFEKLNIFPRTPMLIYAS